MENKARIGHSGEEEVIDYAVKTVLLEGLRGLLVVAVVAIVITLTLTVPGLSALPAPTALWINRQ